MKLLRRSGLAVIALVLIGTLVAGAGSAHPRFTATSVTPESTFTGAKSVTGGIAKTDPALLDRTDSTPVNVLLKYDYDATASYAGGVAGLEATSPAVTGKSLKQNRSAVRAYEQHAAEVSSEISAAVEKAVPDAQISQSFETAYGGVAAVVPANKVADLLKVDGVVAVQADELEQPQTDVTPAFIGATDVWPSIGGSVHAGENVVVGILDTGIWPEHPSFVNNGLPAPPGGPYDCQFGDGSDVADLGPTFACNRKLVGAYAFTSTYLSVFPAEPGEYCDNTAKICSARDADGHGTHTSSTAAGDPVANAPIFGIDRGPVSGMAPGARVIAYRVCLEQGCFPSDSVAAIQQAITDEIDVINFSISGGANPYTDPVELTFLDAFNAGISVNASAGNSGPGAGTADHGGPWVTTVGASTSPRIWGSTLHLTATGGDTLDIAGATVTPGIGATPVVLATAIGATALCLPEIPENPEHPENPSPFPAGSATGKIVVCVRGPNRNLKSVNVKNAGGVGMILVNPILQPTMLFTDNFWIPEISIDGPPTELTSFITGHTGVMARWATGVAAPRTPDLMTEFSSRGPVGDFVKPDVTAPGIQILAGMTPTPVPSSPALGPPGEFFQSIAGTSMSSPHSAGASAVVKAAHPDWTPAMIKSALMTSAATDVLKDDAKTPADPFEDGAGSIRVNRAVNPTLVFDETFDDFVASAADPLHRIDLNIASVDATTMTGMITTKRTATNVSGTDQQLEVSVASPPGAEIFVSDKAPDATSPKADSKIHLKKTGTTDLWITISAPEIADGQYFGRITLDPKRDGANPVTIPIAFVKRQGAVTLTHDCAPTTFAKKTGLAHCTAIVSNFSSIPADVNLTVTNLDKGKGLDFTNISAPATAIKKDDGVAWNGTLTPAIPPQVTSITNVTGHGPDGGYLDLSLIGVGPVTGVGDNTITNFNVPTFYYGGESYSRIGVVSNGYVVIGGGDSTDIVFRAQSFPNPARPNNVLALLWTDLDPTAGGALRVATVTGGPFRWLVVDWGNIPNVGNATTHSFEVWIQLPSAGFGPGPESEGIIYSYGPNLTFPGDGAGLGNAGSGDPTSGQNWGAENRTGTSGKNITPAPPNGSEWSVNTAPPAAGGSAKVTYDASSKKAGTYRSQASMTSNVTPGTTQVVKTLTVTP